MHQYVVLREADAVFFHQVCKHLEGILCLEKLQLLEDVDGTLIQEYFHPRGAITVRNDVPVDVVKVTSDFDLCPECERGHVLSAGGTARTTHCFLCNHRNNLGKID